LFQRAVQGRTPSAADVQQSHTGLQAQLAEGQVDLGDLGFLERHVIALEVRATVGLGRIEKQLEELVGQVVMRLHVLEVRPQVLCVTRGIWQGQPLAFVIKVVWAPRVSRATPVVRAVYAQSV
jgi:hypothetical protein